MLKKCIILFSFLFIINDTFAADTLTNRKERTLFFGVSTGVHVPSLIAPPFSLGIYLSDSLLIGGEAGNAKFTHDEENTEASATFMNSGGYLRWFTGNSFNFLLAYHDRKWDAEATVTEVSESTGTLITASATLEASAKVATLGIGNQWMMDSGVVLGIDWFLGSSLVASSVSHTLTSNVALTAEDRQQIEQEFEDLGETLNEISALPGIFVVTLGFAF